MCAQVYPLKKTKKEYIEIKPKRNKKKKNKQKGKTNNKENFLFQVCTKSSPFQNLKAFSSIQYIFLEKITLEELIHSSLQ